MNESGAFTDSGIDEQSGTLLPDRSCSASAIYPHLCRIARSRLRCGRDTLLDTTALVHESYIRFAQSGSDAADWQSFLRYAPRIMHNVAVDSIRRRSAQVHGGGAVHVEIENGMCAAAAKETEEIAALRRAIEQLALVDQRLAQVVEMRFFEGATESEIAGTLGVTERTVRRDWEKARLLLAQALRS
ncbi:MAG TPA: sigma-70 family RNA polymerase sigma factor [Bryobacteraceae bacterium]